ncbi:protein shisa-5-like isoform X1 [Salarias fasciatus]|uniref:protein shisa-5-like isoform X1 n=1 Tax=Salarias fasciatus TaxID=181472 RepID=UPI0011769AC8|nr:protein shisa-5-like isoform X1 [Salarias fasciatus]
MSSGLSGVVVLALCVIFCSYASADDKDCQAYRDLSSTYHYSRRCYIGFCCGTCNNRYCCTDSAWRLSEDRQDECESLSDMGETLPMIFGVAFVIVLLLIFICCCVCPCCCLYKICHKPRPVIATTTHTTVVTSTPQQYPQQPVAVHAPPQQYPGGQYQPPYQSIPVQPGYPAQPSAYHGQPYGAGPPPTYQEAIGPMYPSHPAPYSQAAFGPGQPPYPLQPAAKPQANAPPAGPDFLAQPAYNPDYVAPPHQTG